MMNNTRKGYATVEDIRKISIAKASAINGGGRNHLEAEGRELYLAPWRRWWSELVYLTGASFCQLLHDTERFQFINSIGKGYATSSAKASYGVSHLAASIQSFFGSTTIKRRRNMQADRSDWKRGRWFFVRRCLAV
ncbi:hypothetical protein F2Q69_00018311 [Brassica cretica]|uniref:Uncharacterized protein n=1 Tax=Brassica cretica TaxID=69181 RepID=A0A8S9QFP5_BRACR|nr:hypothetical protein F2Q69_00018311 [Brassica cretica]